MSSQGGPGDFELVALQGAALVHYRHPNASPAAAWLKAQVITGAATGPGCIIQSSFGIENGVRGNLEVLVPEAGHVQHYFLISSAPNTAWQRGQSFGTGVTGPASMIEGDFKSGVHGNFEAVVLEGANLVHYWHDNSNAALPWQRGAVITNHATGGGAIIQTDFLAGGHGNLEVLVQEGDHVSHYWREAGSPADAFHFGGSFGSGVTGRPDFIQSSFGRAQSKHGNFEAVLMQGSRLVHWFKDNSKTSNAWRQAQDIARDGPVHSAAAIIQSSFGAPAQLGNFEVAVLRDPAPTPPDAVVQGGPDFALAHYFHNNANVAAPWQRAPDIAYRGRSEKVCQLTGSQDKQRGEPTTNATGEQAGLGATDLGYPVDNGQTLSLYFGDTRDQAGRGLPSEWSWDDAVGVSHDVTAPTYTSCLHLAFPLDSTKPPHFARLVVQQAGPSPPERRLYQGLFNVPTSGFAAGDAEFTLFWTDHCAFPKPDGVSCTNPAPDTDTVGTARLARNTGPAQFQELFQLPSQFLYTAAVNTAFVRSVPPNQNIGVLLYGVANYRSSYPHLATVAAGSVATPAAWRYFTGLNQEGAPSWGNDPALSAPVFSSGDPGAGCIGEFSVSWVMPLGRWLMLYNCPGGVWARVALAPWGPWSAPTEIFSADVDPAQCRFLHQEGNAGCIDWLAGDNGRDNGNVYAPFILSRFTQAAQGGASIYYLLSTWNPYQVVVMHTVLSAR